MWKALHFLADYSHLVTPVLLIGCAFLAYRTRRVAAATGMLGATLYAGNFLVAISYDGGMHAMDKGPGDGTNPFHFFALVYGDEIGLLLFAVSLFVALWPRRRHATPAGTLSG